MEKKACKKCGKELPEDRDDKLCEECREKRNGPIRKILIDAGTVGVAAAAVLVSTAGKSKKDDNDIDDDYDEPTENDEMAFDKMDCDDFYHGYIPVGCRACGGPYPHCKDSCPLYDD